MYLSLLRLNPRSRRAMTEASRPYELHRSLLTAFPDKAAGGPGRVLFRLDTDRETGSMSVLVQSEKKPDWARLNGATGFVTECKCKEFEPKLAPEQVLRFRLLANPTKRTSSTGKRQGILNDEDQLDWLRNKGIKGGFKLINAFTVNEGFSKDKMTDRNDAKHSVTMLAVRFDGILRVIDPDVFRCTIQDGIGSAKGLGFGLLSIAQAKV